MPHETSTALLKECDDATFLSSADFRAAHLAYVRELSKLGTQIAHLQGLIDVAEDGETHPGTLQRIDGLERQAHAVQQHHDKARSQLQNLREAVAQLDVCTEEFRREYDDPTPTSEG